jgi:hypothetical protein
VDYVVLHKTEPRDDAVYRDFIETVLGPSLYEDRVLAVFPVRSETPAPGDCLLYAFSRGGWHMPEKDGDVWRRWLEDGGQIYIYSVLEEVGNLRFSVDSHQEFPVLEVYLEEQLLDSLVVDERETYTTRPFTLTQGMNVLRFHASEGCTQVVDNPRCWGEALLVPPAEDAPLPCDPSAVRTTCRSFIFDDVSFVPKDALSIGEGLDVNFGDQMRLRGWGLEAQELHPGGVLTVTLAWEPAVALNDRYVVFVHLLDPDGTLVAQDDAPPVGNLPSPSAWPLGATFAYPVRIELPADLPAGDYRLLVGAYLWPDVQRLPVLTEVDGAETGVVYLTTLRVAP